MSFEKSNNEEVKEFDPFTPKSRKDGKFLGLEENKKVNKISGERKSSMKMGVKEDNG